MCTCTHNYFHSHESGPHGALDNRQGQRRVFDAIDYLHTIDRKWFKLGVRVNMVPYGETDGTFKTKNGIILAHYESKYVKDAKFYYGIITLNVETLAKQSIEEIRETIRHEYAHAVVALKYGLRGCVHGQAWINVAKMLRCDVKRYEWQLKHKCNIYD